MDRQTAIANLKKKLSQRKYHGNTGGYAYLKNGDFVGEQCPKCGDDMLINKSGKWKVYCHCGYETHFRRRDVDFDPHWSEIDDPSVMRQAWCDCRSRSTERG